MEESRVAEFVVRFEKLISDNLADDALNEILDPDNEDILRIAALELLIPVGSRMTDGHLFKSDIGAWCSLQTILDYIVKISKPKEILIGLLELLDQTQSDEFFGLIIRPLKVTFLRLPTKNVDTLLWALNGLYKYISKLSLPDYDGMFDCDDEQQGGHRRKMILFENCPELNRLDLCVNNALHFVEPFVSEAKECKLLESFAQRNNQVMALTSFLLKLLEKPVAYYDISKDKRKSNAFRYETAERLVSMLFDLTPNIFWKIVDWSACPGKLSILCKFFDDDDESAKSAAIVKPLALGVLASHVFCFKFSRQKLPNVYAHLHTFDSLLPPIVGLLKESAVSPGGECCVRLALKLCKFFSDFFPRAAWTDDRLIDLNLQDFYMSLIYVTTYCNSKKLRRKALVLFNDYLEMLTSCGKLSVIRMIFYFSDQNYDSQVQPQRWRIANNGVRGYMIDYYRNQLRLEITNDDKSKSYSDSDSFESWLPYMLGLYTVLPSNETTDLLEYFDQYMAVLNLLRYLCLIFLARAQKQSGGFRLVPRLRIKILLQKQKEKFLDVLLTAIDLSKAHYELDLKNALSESDAQAPKGHVTNSEEMAVLQQAINSYDMLSSLIGRVNELVTSCLLNSDL